LGTDILVAAMLTGTSELNLFVFHVWQGAGEILGDILEAMSQAGPAVRNSAAAIETSTLNYFFFFFCASVADDVHISFMRRTTARGRAWRTCSGSSRSCS